MDLDTLEDFIREKVVIDKWTHAKLSIHLQRIYPGVKGLSVRSLQRFCQEKEIHKTSRLKSQELDEVVAGAVAKVGPTYGRKTMTGLLAAQGIKVSEQRVGQSLQRVSPNYQQARRTATARQVNPIPYHADYFGHKIHVDQNEKLVMFGVTHICAIDGYSGKVVGLISMPVKNCIEIYTHLYLPLIREYGLWDQVRVDQGKEWYLMLFIQEKLAHLRYNPGRFPHLQTSSKQNHTVERMWVEVNGRVNYPIKSCLITLQERGYIDIDCPHECFIVSWFTIRVANVGLKLAVEAWNNHRIPGAHRGVPNDLMRRDNRAVALDSHLLPNPDEAVRLYESYGGRLTLFSSFGADPLQSRGDLIHQREVLFKERYPNYEPFFYTTVNGDNSLFCDGLMYLLRMSKQLELLL